VWPNLWGPGWWWGVLISLGLVAGLVALFGRLDSVHREPEDRMDQLQDLWRRYEQGDLAQWEFQRLRRRWLDPEKDPPRQDPMRLGHIVRRCCPSDEAALPDRAAPRDGTIVQDDRSAFIQDTDDKTVCPEARHAEPLCLVERAPR